VAAGGAATPSAGATAGNTGGQGQSVLQLVPSGNYVVTALFNGYRVTDSGTGQSSDTIPQFGLVLRVDDLSDGIRGNSSVSIGDPQNWLFKRLARFDATPGGLGIATGTYNKVLNLGFVVEVMRPGIGPVGTTPPPFPFDITNTLGGAVTQYLVTGPGTLVIADPDDPDFFAANGSGIPGVSAITTNNNQFDFSRVDGSKLHNVFVIDAANSQPSTVTVDADLFDAAILQRIAVDSGRFTGFLAKFFEIRADAVDQVTFADPQNWEVDGLLANGQLQYHALNTVNLVFLEMPATLAAKPAYRFAGTAADDTIRIPDLDIGLIDGGGGVNTLQIVGASADLAALGPGRIANFGFLDFSAGGTADTITVDHAFVAASAPGGHLTLLGDAADRAVVADLATAWTYNGHFTASPDGTPHLFLQFRAPADGALLDVQSELATLFPPIDRVGTAGDDVLPIDATPLAQRIDGGAGFDRLQPMGAGALDLTALALGSSVRNVEALDLRGQGANALTLDDVFVADSTVDGVLSVLGEAGDSLTLTGGWTKTGSFPVGAQVFDRWQATTPLGEAVVAFVDQQLQTQAA
jgi:hypothetical protein